MKVSFFLGDPPVYFEVGNSRYLLMRFNSYSAVRQHRSSSLVHFAPRVPFLVALEIQQPTLQPSQNPVRQEHSFIVNILKSWTLSNRVRMCAKTINQEFSN